jgi:Domain of unknown function (DUF5666)
MHHFSTSLPALRPLQAWFKALCAAAVLVGCGGGGTSPGDSGTFAYGPISGFGSIIVNGVRYDDSSSSVSSEDDDDNPGRSSGDLKLGMVVQVKAGSIQSDDSGRRSSASEIRFGSEIVGPVGTKGTDSFTLLGQTVKVSTSTVYDASSNPPLTGFAQIAQGDVLEVYGLLDTAGNVYTATRIERKNNASEYKIRGAISALDDSATGKTFKIGSETISYASATKLPSSLANGQIVRAKLQTAKNAAGAWVATRVKNGAPSMSASGEAEIKGTVEGLASGSRSFKVNGIDVDANGATIYPASLANGAFVEVEGSLSGGKLVARKVELEDSSSSSMGSFEFHGKVEARTGDRITVRSTPIELVSGTAFDRGATLANVIIGTCVEVKTNASMTATYIKLDNDCL